jgi:hypothetical protein
MAHDHGFRMQGLDFVERLEPLVYRLFVAFREIEVRVVVHAISGYDQIDRGHIQRSCVRCVGVAELNDLQLFALKVKGIAIEDFGRAANCDGSWPGKRGSQNDLTYSGLIWS